MRARATACAASDRASSRAASRRRAKLKLGRATAFVAAVLALGVRAGAEPPTVVVEPGDSLAKIAERTLGDAALWPELYRANRDRIKDPTRVYPGQELSLPQPSAPAAVPEVPHGGGRAPEAP